MADVKKKEMPLLFTKENYKWMLIGIVILVIGMVLMSGGKSDANGGGSFDFKDVYSARRITVAPIVILLGLAVEIFAIFKKPKKANAEA